MDPILAPIGPPTARPTLAEAPTFASVPTTPLLSFAGKVCPHFGHVTIITFLLMIMIFFAYSFPKIGIIQVHKKARKLILILFSASRLWNNLVKKNRHVHLACMYIQNKLKYK